MVKKFKWYPAEDDKKPFERKSKAKKAKAPKARKGLVAGAVCIVLSGRFRGKRVIVLKTLPSGMALVTGPYKINGVPVRRMNPAYLLITSTKVDFDPKAIKDLDTLNDKHFAKPKTHKKAIAAKVVAGDKAEKEAAIEVLLILILILLDAQGS
jgi:large subunit ribosomal protein L6e